MTLLPDWEPLHVSNIFTPAILICDQEKETQEKEKFRNLGTYRELFYENDVLQKRVILLGEAGAGKTTFIKHLTDVWSEKTTEPQFSDVDEVKQFQYFFYVSCRFAEEKETILDMINNQLFEDETIKAVAIYMLKHHPECCLILLDGADEWKGSPTSETGRRGDITGLPSMTGVEGCVILITSRPWRFHALSTKARGIFKLLKISGIKNVQVLAYRILEQLEDPDPKQSSYEFLRQIRENNMSALMKIPLILIIALGGWVSDKSLHRSITVNYINMIQSFISRSKGQAGWSSSESKLRQLVPHLETLETAWGQKSNELPHLLSKYQSIRRYAGLFLSLGQLAFDLLLGKEEQSLVFSKEVFKSYLPADDENDESVNVCLALGILSKTETSTRGLRKLESYAFCHKTFQEFFAALWLASKYSNEESKLYKSINGDTDQIGFEILIMFLCGFDPKVGKRFWKRFWMFLAEEAEIVEKRVKWEREDIIAMKDMQEMVCKCMKEHRFDQKDQTSDQIYFCISYIVIDKYTSKEDVLLLCHVMEEYPCNVKSLHVDDCQSQLQTICSGLQSLKLSPLPSVNENSDSLISPILDLQKHDKLETLWLQHISIEGLLLPVEGARITSLYLDDVTITHQGREPLSESLASCSHLVDLDLREMRCREHWASCCIPDKLEKLELHDIYIEGLLLPVEGARITSLKLNNVTITHHGCEQLSESLSSCSHLEELSLTGEICREHWVSCCIAVVDLQKHDKLKTLDLQDISIEGLLLPVEGARITSLMLNNVTMPHHRCEQLSESLSSCSHLEELFLTGVRCRRHGASCCIAVLDLQKHDKLKTLELFVLSIEGLLLPVEGARITSLRLFNVTMTLHGLEQLSECLSSCSYLEYLYLDEVRCREHSDSCCIPVLALQKHDKLETLVLRDISIVGLLLPVEGARITLLTLDMVTMSHHGWEQLPEYFTSSSCLEYLCLNEVRCREHRDCSCIPVLDLQKHDKLEKLALWSLSIEGLLLPVEGARITLLTLHYITMSHHGWEQLSESLSADYSSRPEQENWRPYESWISYKVICREHGDGSCQPVKDITNFIESRQ